MACSLALFVCWSPVSSRNVSSSVDGSETDSVTSSHPDRSANIQEGGQVGCQSLRYANESRLTPSARRGWSFAFRTGIARAKILVAGFDDCRPSICPLLFTSDIHSAGCPKQSNKIKFISEKSHYQNRIRSFRTTSPPIHYQTQTITSSSDHSKAMRSRRKRTPRCWNFSRCASSTFAVETMTSETAYCERSAGRSVEAWIG